MDGVNEPDENDKILTFWIQMRKNIPLNESHKTGQTSGTEMTFCSKKNPIPVLTGPKGVAGQPNPSQTVATHTKMTRYQLLTGQNSLIHTTIRKYTYLTKLLINMIDTVVIQ
ncbi:hypothetical protein Hanom_Chr16g01429791 [Helianthus anomalus]